MHFQYPIDYNILEYKTFLFSKFHLTKFHLLCCVSTSKEKLSKQNSPPTLLNIFFLCSLPSSPSFSFASFSSLSLLLPAPPFSFCSIKKPCFLPVKCHTRLMTARLKSISVLILVSVLLYSYATIF